MNIDELLAKIKGYNPKANLELIRKAYGVARKAHEGQKRASGTGFIEHPLSAANILTEHKADSATICAALLHDVVEDTQTDIKNIEKEFGEEVASLVEGVTKTKEIQFSDKEQYKAENLRKVLLATTKDIRVMLVKLADRLHNMRTLRSLSEEKQKRISGETLRIYAPIAEKLGMWSIKGELEDLSFKCLDPETYQMLKKKIVEKRAEREKKTEEIIELIKKRLEEKKISAVVSGRAKYFYSIYKKMIKEDKTFDQIYDLVGIRIIVNRVEDCYDALSVIHQMWFPLKDRVKDYIEKPKPNGYQSVHTTVKHENKLLEVQIRTKEMELYSEEGIASHWLYKQTERDKKFDKKISLLKQLLRWRRSIKHSTDFLEDFKIDLFKNEIIVITPKGDPVILRDGATPVDFAYEVHSSVGDHCSKAKVNNKIVPLDAKLKSGDIVEIITNSAAKPSRNWLKFVVTSKAKAKIRGAVGIEVERKKGEKKEEEPRILNLADYIEVPEGKKAPIKISKCCGPELNDPIVGFYTKDGKITMHKKACINIHALDKNKKVRVEWRAQEKEKGASKITIVAQDRIGLLANILDVISSQNINIKSVNTKSGKYEQIIMTLDINKEELDELIKMIKSVKSIVEVLTE